MPPSGASSGSRRPPSFRVSKSGGGHYSARVSHKNLGPPLRWVDRHHIEWKGRRLLCFGGCDYHRLSMHSAVVRAAALALKRHGLNVAASRATTGNHPLFAGLERKLAHFFKAPAALLTPNGFLTNMVVAEALRGEIDLALVDERSHASLTMAAEHLGCTVHRFPHRDARALGRLLESHGRGRRLALLTDGMFSHDGSVAPLAEYDRVLPDDAVIVVDDAHGAGVLGRYGRGTLEHASVTRRRVIQSVTLSKAFGTHGGAVLGSRAFADRVLTASRSFAGATPMPLPLAGAAIAALSRVAGDDRLLGRLHRNTAFVKESLNRKHWPSVRTPGPSVCFTPENARERERLGKALLVAGIFPSLVRYGAGPSGGYFRFVISSAHTRKQLGALVSVLATIKD